MKVLLVEDDLALSDVVSFTLRRAGYVVVAAYDGLAALEQFVTWGRMQHKAQSKGGHATFDMLSLRDEIVLAELAIASVKPTTP